MLITEIAKKLNITPRTIRHYEEIGVIKSNRLENNYRYFNIENINKEFVKEVKEKREKLRLSQVRNPQNTDKLFEDYKNWEATAEEKRLRKVKRKRGLINLRELLAIVKVKK